MYPILAPPKPLHTILSITAWGISSPLYMAYTKLLGKSVPQGAATHVFLATAPEVKDISGKYWVDCRPEPYWVRT